MFSDKICAEFECVGGYILERFPTVKCACKFVWIALPIPSRMIKSHLCSIKVVQVSFGTEVRLIHGDPLPFSMTIICSLFTNVSISESTFFSFSRITCISKNVASFKAGREFTTRMTLNIISSRTWFS